MQAERTDEQQRNRIARSWPTRFRGSEWPAPVPLAMSIWDIAAQEAIEVPSTRFSFPNPTEND